MNRAAGSTPVNEYIDICYMKRHRLTPEAIEELDHRGLAETAQALDSVPLPPPRPFDSSDLGIYLLYETTFIEERNFDDLIRSHGKIFRLFLKKAYEIC